MKIIKISIALIISGLFTIKGIAAANIIPEEIEIPSAYGTIRDTYDAGPGSKLIVHIQDAHNNPSAQRNIAEILKGLYKDYGIELILLEGAIGKIDNSDIRRMGVQSVIEEVAERKLNEGRLNGALYADLTTIYPFKLYGVENNEAYVANGKSIVELNTVRPKIAAEIEKLRIVTNRLKNLIYSDSLKEFEKKEASYLNDEIGVVQYHRYLKSIADEKNLDINAYPNIKSLLDADKLEQDLDFFKADEEKDALVQELKKLLSEDKIAELDAKTASFRANKLKPVDYHNYLKGLTHDARRTTHDYSNFADYTEYLNVHSAVDSDKLFREEDKLENETRLALCEGYNQKRLVNLSAKIDTLIDFWNIKMSPDEVKGYFEDRNNFITATWVPFINRNAAKHGMAEVNYDAEFVDSSIGILEQVYNLAEQRDLAIIENSIRYISEEAENKAVLNIGGFHTPRLTSLLKDKGYSYVVIAPRVEVSTDKARYFKAIEEGVVFMEEKNSTLRSGDYIDIGIE